MRETNGRVDCTYQRPVTASLFVEMDVSSSSCCCTDSSSNSSSVNNNNTNNDSDNVSNHSKGDIDKE